MKDDNRIEKLLLPFKSLGVNLLERIVPSIHLRVMYEDYDVVCFRSSKGEDLIFRMNPEIDINKFIEEFDLRKYSKLYRSNGKNPLVVIDMMSVRLASGDVIECQSAKPSLPISAFALAGFYEIPEAEICLMFETATKVLLAGFDTRLRNMKKPIPEAASQQITPPCA